MNWQRTYAAIDLKSFYASVECRERGLDPLTAKLVVADPSRTSKTICLAVTPALKAYGISGRARLFEVEERVAQIRNETGEKIQFITAVPRMSLYIKYSSRIYGIYLKFFSPEDVHVYSIDEVFIDMTSYLKFYKTTAYELTMKVIKEILKETGITATAGIAPNLYLCKIAMDIVAKHNPPDKDGVRIAELDEMEFRKRLWNHRPITDFWRIGNGTAARLAKYFMFTMGDVARFSLTDSKLLYKLFGMDAEILIDHAWGYEPCGMKEIKSYKSSSTSLSNGQVLQRPYDYEEAKIAVREMADLLAMELFEKQICTSSITLYIGYDRSCVGSLNPDYRGNIAVDAYGRLVPAPAGGTVNFGGHTNSDSQIVEGIMYLFTKITDPHLKVRRINLGANNVISCYCVQPDLFDETDNFSKERALQKTRIEILHRFGKNALLKGTNFEEGAMTIERNKQIGGHKA